jgi:endogenous inhibitor of DNA gyrase (YacG/DUF329 family)
MNPTTTPCPTCGEPTDPGRANPWRPFCSERCKLIDLAAWLGGDYAIPGEAAEAPAPEPEDR